MMKPVYFLFVALGLVAACSHQPDVHFWRYNDTASALYMNGPKAQQQLEVDISTCVHEIVEIAKLEAVRNGTPALALGKLGRVEHHEIAQTLSRMPHWETPEYVRDLRVNHTDYHDFESCMRSRGWERSLYVHPKAGARALDVYDKTEEYFGEEERTTSYHKDYEIQHMHLNE